MKEVGITALRQHLPEYIAMVAEGETVRVTLRGRVVAEIAPPTPAKDEASAARKRLRGSVLRYDQPLEPAIAPDEWDMNR